MKKPKVQTKKFLDWIELRPYLQENEIKVDKIIGLVAAYGDFHNGCDIPFERPEGAIYEPPVQKMVELLFEKFPEAVEDDDTITVYFWW